MELTNTQDCEGIATVKEQRAVLKRMGWGVWLDREDFLLKRQLHRDMNEEQELISQARSQEESVPCKGYGMGKGHEMEIQGPEEEVTKNWRAVSEEN